MNHLSMFMRRSMRVCFRSEPISLNRKYTSNLKFFRERQLEKKFSVIEIFEDGSIQTCSRSSRDLIAPDLGKSANGISPRDLFALDIGPDVDQHLTVHSSISKRISPPVILPRNDAIVVNIGSIKAVVGTQKITVFEPKQPLVKQWTYNFLKSIQSDYESEKSLPFELFALENILKSTCETFERRLLLFGPLVENVLLQLEKEDLFDGLDKLLPLRDTLHQFEIDVKEILDCLTTLLANDDDMALLLLSEATPDGDVDISRHVVVELLVESYAMRLKHTISKLAYQEQKVKNRYEAAEFTMQLIRNRILRMNLYTGMAGVSMGLGTAIFGAFGMNVDLPAFSSVFGREFNTTIAVALIMSTIIYAGAFNYSKGIGLRQVRLRRAEHLSLLNSIFTDFHAVDYAVRESVSAMSSEIENNQPHSTSTGNAVVSGASSSQMASSTTKKSSEDESQTSNLDEGIKSRKDVWREGRRVTKDDFARFMRFASGGKEVNDKTVDLFFGILDADKDGYLSMSESSLMDEKLEPETNTPSGHTPPSSTSLKSQGDKNSPPVQNHLDKLSTIQRRPF